MLCNNITEYDENNIVSSVYYTLNKIKYHFIK